ncbi:MAG: hypothetical protein H6540_03560 [Bacteroidales bacterium]|nr:hypothetical protein [Bacteroidales bacterium]
MSDFQLTQYSKDTSAAAVFLFDDGDIEFRVNNNGSFQYVFSRHFRIKIFKKSALGLADFSISLYQKGSSKEELSNLNASSYNLVDGKVVESKLKNDEIFKETSENHIVKKFALAARVRRAAPAGVLLVEAAPPLHPGGHGQGPNRSSRWWSREVDLQVQ